MTAERPNALRAAEQTIKRLEVENSRLRNALTDAIQAFEECTGDYAKELVADDLVKWCAPLYGTIDEPGAPS